MDNKNIIPISVEKFAAYLDGNLPENEMQQISQLADHYESLQQLIGASSIIDDTMSSLLESELSLPPEITDSFNLPSILTEDVNQLINLSPDFSEELLNTAVFAEDDCFQHIPNNSEDNLGFNDNQDCSSNDHSFKNEDFQGEDEAYNSLPDDI